MKYATVAFPSSPAAFTYSADFDVKVGDLVAAPFRSRVLNGIVLEISEKEPDYPTKPLQELIREQVLNDWQVATINWLAKYYAAHVGKTCRLFVPERVFEDKPLKRKTKTEEIQVVAQKKKQLNPAQQAALDTILKSKKPCLLHGITGSGKTEVYLQAILESLKSGKQAILLAGPSKLVPRLACIRRAASVHPEPGSNSS